MYNGVGNVDFMKAEGREMGYDKKLIAAKLVRWENYITAYDLPDWEQLPHMQLYMDQVVSLICEYLSHFVYSGNDEKLLTRSMVNNYVKLGVVPPRCASGTAVRILRALSWCACSSRRCRWRWWRR